MKHSNLFTVVETFNQPDGRTPAVTRVAAGMVITNPLAGQPNADNTVMLELGQEVGGILADQAASLLPEAPDVYGKAAIIGAAGTLDQGAALIHVKLGGPLRERIGGGTALIPSNMKMGGPGTSIDIPVCHRNDPWQLHFIDTMTVHVAEAPLPDQICVLIALGCGSRITLPTP